MLPERIVEGHDMRSRGCEGAGQHAFECIDPADRSTTARTRRRDADVRRAVSAPPARTARRGADAAAFAASDRYRPAPHRSGGRGASGSKPLGGMRHREEVAMDEAAARIAGELLAERQQALLRAIRSPRPARRPRSAIARPDFPARPARCSRARVRRRRHRDRRASSAASPSRASAISATVNWLDIRNSSPSLIS